VTWGHQDDDLLGRDQHIAEVHVLQSDVRRGDHLAVGAVARVAGEHDERARAEHHLLDADRVDTWREFGERFGVLRQLLNDQRDLASGRYEDLRNSTATLMMVRYLASLADDERSAAEKLLVECAGSAEAREQFAAHLTEPARLRGFADFVRPLIDGLHASVESFGGIPEYAAGLHDLINETINLYPEFLLGSAPVDLR